MISREERSNMRGRRVGWIEGVNKDLQKLVEATEELTKELMDAAEGRSIINPDVTKVNFEPVKRLSEAVDKLLKFSEQIAK
jgi:hypothetical protein